MRRFHAASVIVLALSALVGNAEGAPYVVTDLGTLGGNTSWPSGINNNGQIVGGSTTAGGIENAFLWSNGTMKDLGTAGSFSWAASVNTSGSIVGQNSDGAFLYANGTTTALAGAGATCINDQGLAVGESRDWCGCLFTQFGAQDITSAEGVANGVNNNGQVVGGASVSSGSDRSHAFLYSSGTIQDLGTLSSVGADSSSCATAINNAGQIVGYACTSDNATYHGFLYSNAAMHDLGGLGSTIFSVALAINGGGSIVGYSKTNTGIQHAFLYSDGTMQDLNGLISPTLGIVLNDATAINDNGLITCAVVGTGFERAVLLTPAMRGDANLDGRVDINDLNAVLANYDKSIGITWAKGDFNNDGRVDINDLNAVLGNYDRTVAAPGGLSAVPEPAILPLLLAAVVCSLARAIRPRTTRAAESRIWGTASADEPRLPVAPTRARNASFPRQDARPARVLRKPEADRGAAALRALSLGLQ